MSSEGGALTTVEHSGFTITSNSGATPEQLRESLNAGREPEATEEPEKPDISKAASELGKKGGEAAAKARAKAAKAKPIPDKKEAKDDDSEAAADGGASEGRGREGDEGDAAASKAGGSGDTSEAADSKRDNPRHDAQARIRELAEERRQARDRAERAEREAAEYRYRLERAERERQPERKEPEPAPPQGKPQPGEFETYEEYLDARDKWNRDEWTKETTRQYQTHQAAASHVQRITATADAFKSALNKAAESDPEFREKITPEIMNLGPSFMLEPGQQPNQGNWIADELLSAPERAPSLMLYLSEHPNEFQRIAALSSPRAITRELAILSVRLDAATAGPSSERRVSKANPPPTPVGGSPAAASGKYRPGMSLDEYARIWKP